MIDQNAEELSNRDRKTRKIITIYREVHSYADIDRPAGNEHRGYSI